MPICSYAQNFEDVLLWRALKDVERGTYLDIGAQDPIFDSVSKGFYELGWRGVHVEPTAAYAALLRKDRPDEIVIQAAVSSEPGTLRFYEIPDTGLSTGSDEIVAGIRDRGWNVHETLVVSVTLDQILADFEGRPLHWLKIDVEGFETQALEGWRTSSVRPWIIVVEAIAPSTHVKTHREWEQLLRAKGYAFVHFDGLNRYYVSDEHKELKKHFAYGPSLWDGLILPEISRPAQALVQRRDEMLAQSRAALDAEAAARSEALVQVASLGQALADATGALDQTRAQLVQMRHDSYRSRAEATQANGALVQALSVAEHAQSELTQTQQALAEAREDRERAQSDVAHSHEELGQIRNALDRSQDAFDQAYRDLEQTRAELAETRGERDRVRDALEQMRHLSEQWSRQRARLMGELSEITGSLWWRITVPFRKPSKVQAILADVTLDRDLGHDGVWPAPGPVLGQSAPAPTVASPPVVPRQQPDVAPRLAAIKSQLDQLEQIAHQSRLASIAVSPSPRERPVGTIDAVAEVAKKQDDIVPSRPLAWRFEGSASAADDLSLTKAEMSRALAELGHTLRPSSAGVTADVTACVEPPPLPARDREGLAILVGHDWDESGYPVDWIDQFNTNLDGVACTTSHTVKILADHGLTVATAATGVGVDQWERMGADPDYWAPGKGFRFLHVSTTGADKGLDLLLESFGRLFASDDDVSLVIKPLGPVAAEITTLLDDLRDSNPNFPDVVLVGDDISESQLKALYAQCHVFVAPSRAEGFGLPIAQALLSWLPVVATARGGHLDYCDESNAWLVDYRFLRASTPNDLMDSVWFEPTENALDDALLKAYRASPAERFAKAWAGRKRLLDQFTWNDAALRLAALAEAVDSQAVTQERKSRVGWVTTWNVKCGIFTHVQHLLDLVPSDDVVIFAGRQEPRTLPDEQNCLRSWTPGKDDNRLDEVSRRLDSWSVDALVIQFNYGFYNHVELNAFIEAQVARGVVVIVDVHSTIDTAADQIVRFEYGDGSNWRLAELAGALRKCHRVLAHGPADMDRLKALGIVDNVMLLPAGVLNPGLPRVPPVRSPDAPAVVASFGFCFPDKGLRELVEALALLKAQGKQVRLLMLNAIHPHPASEKEADALRRLISELGLEDEIDLNTDFLDDDVCLSLLRTADLIVNPYQETGESASGSARYGLAADCPVAVTPLAIFDDLGGAVYRLPGVRPAQIAEGISEALGHIRGETATAVRVRETARRWVKTHDFAQQGLRLMKMAQTLVRTEISSGRRRHARPTEQTEGREYNKIRGVFINTAPAICSIFESGCMVYNCIKSSYYYTLDYLSLDMFDIDMLIMEGVLRRLDVAPGSEDEFPEPYDFWVFNWHHVTMAPSLDGESIRRLPGRKFTVVLELEPGDPLKMVPKGVFDGYIALDPSAHATDQIFPFPRPLQGDPRTSNPPTRAKPVIGSFGFDTPGKGFELLVEAVNNEFDEAVVRVNIPRGTYTSSTDMIHNHDYASYIGQICQKIAKPGIEVQFTHDYMTPEQLLDWCADNDLNCFMYTRRQTGLSATTDQAIMSGRPLLTSSNDTFRHIHQYIPPYPVMGMREAIETTPARVAEMQHDWSKAAFGGTFERMIATFGLIGLDAQPDAPVSAIDARRPTILVASPRSDTAEDVRQYPSRVADSLSRPGKYEIECAQFDSLAELTALAMDRQPSALVVVDGPDPVAVSEALTASTALKMMITDRVDLTPEHSDLITMPRRPLIPYYTSVSGLRSAAPSIWLIGFSAPGSNVEALVTKIWREMPDAELFLEVQNPQRREFGARIAKLRKRLRRSRGGPSPMHELPPGGDNIIGMFVGFHLTIFYNDPNRTHDIESIMSMALTTERPVAFTRAAPFPGFGPMATYVEDHAIADIIAMGVSAQMQLYHRYGEWQLYADVDRLITGSIADEDAGSSTAKLALELT